MGKKALIIYNQSNLKSVLDENIQIRNIFERLGREVIEVESIPDVNMEILFNHIPQSNGISILHFAGHAGGKSLHFFDQIVDGSGIHGFFASPPDLVFLNGCSTDQLVESFIKKTQIVISTSFDVPDLIACEFAIKFYTQLSLLKTAEESFIVASSFMKAKYYNGVQNGNSSIAYSETKKNDKELVRHFVLSNSESTKKTEFEFKITFKDQNSKDYKLSSGNIYNQQLSDPFIDLVLKIAEKSIDIGIELINSGTITALELEELNKCNLEFIESGNDSQNITKLYLSIHSLLPQPLAQIFNHLFSSSKEIINNKPNGYSQYLKNLLKFYEILLKLATFSMLASLFETIQSAPQSEELKRIVKNPSLKIKINILLENKEDTLSNFDFRDLNKMMRDYLINLKDHGFKHQIDDFDHLSESSINFKLDISADIINHFKNLDLSKSNQLELRHFSQRVEKELIEVIEETYFILKYRLYVIRKIEAVKLKYNVINTYQHKAILLKQQNESSFISYDQSNNDIFTDNYSVIISKDSNYISKYLSLSPFLIDKYVLTVSTNEITNSDLYFFSHLDEDYKLVYKSIIDPNSKIEIETKDLSKDDNMPVRFIWTEEIAKSLKIDKIKTNERLRYVLNQYLHIRDGINKIL